MVYRYYQPAGLRQLIKIVKECNKGPLQDAPKILLICPPPLIKIPNLFPQFDDNSIEKSRTLPSQYQQLAKIEDCYFLDASLIITASKLDGIHFDEDHCALLANAVAKKISEIFKD